jgi:rhamnulokinase
MNALLCQLTADVSGRRVVAGPVEAAALGNVMVQLAASREVGSLREIRSIVRASVAVTEYEPDSATGAELYGRFADSVLSADAAVAT